MSRVERIDDSQEAPRHPQQPRESQPDARKISRTPGSAEGEERTVDEALRHQEQDREARD